MEKAITFLLKQAVCAYRRHISKLFAPSCRYYPSCSQYALLCLDQFSLLKALLKTTIRIFKCNPLFPGGEDFP